MSPLILLFILRIGLAVLLYSFLAALFWMLWQDVRAAARESATRARRLGRLVVLDSPLPGLAAGTTFPLLPVTSLGRAPTNTAPLPDDTASLEHALLHLHDGQWWLEDLDSRNGTRLNSQKIAQPTPIVPGDVIGVGRVKLKIEFE
jgi:FHA domain-containing protein